MTTARLLLLASTLLATSLFASACGGGADTPCERAAEAFCDQACACTPGDECTAIDGGSSSTADDRQSCIFFNSLACSDDETTDEEWTACEEAVQAGQCTTENGRTGLEQVDECRGLLL